MAVLLSECKYKCIKIIVQVFLVFFIKIFFHQKSLGFL